MRRALIAFCSLAMLGYVRHHDLGGIMFWELTGDTDDGDLTSAIHGGLTRGPD